jgi:hypothetical protein
MRFLYGDSGPFPPQYDFLAALEVFCAQAARVVRVDAETRTLRLSADDAAKKRSASVDELEAFHVEAIFAMRDRAKGIVHPIVADYTTQLCDQATRIVEDARRSAARADERDQAGIRTERERRRADVHDALERLLIAVRLPVTDTQVSMQHVEGRNDFTAVFTHEGELVETFALAVDGAEPWRQPCRVAELAQGLNLPVGVRRGLFKRTVAPETIALDEYVLGGFELREDRADLRLRKRSDLPDSLVFAIRRSNDRLSAEVHHPDDAEAESGLTPTLDEASTAQVERLWQLLSKACTPLYVRKKRLIRLSLGGSDVVDQDLGTKVVTLVVAAIAPIVSEVSRRSPNAHELSLKMENDSGRREEIYLRKAQLVSALATVTPKERVVFDPLGLIASGVRDGDGDVSASLPEDALLGE